MAHITGGGIENVPRVLPQGWTWQRKDWEWPAIFREVQARTGFSDDEMLKTLNCGVGMTVILADKDWAKASAAAQSLGFAVFDLGTVHS